MDIIERKNMNEIIMSLKSKSASTYDYKGVTDEIFRDIYEELVYLVFSVDCPIKVEKNYSGIEKMAKFLFNSMERKTDIMDAVYLLLIGDGHKDVLPEYFAKHEDNYLMLGGRDRQLPIIRDTLICVSIDAMLQEEIK